MNCPGSFCTTSLRISGSASFFVNNESIITESSFLLGRKRTHPLICGKRKTRFSKKDCESDSDLHLEIKSATILSFVVTRAVFNPKGLLISRAHSRRPKARPNGDDLHPLIAQISAEVLSA